MDIQLDDVLVVQFNKNKNSRIIIVEKVLDISIGFDINFKIEGKGFNIDTGVFQIPNNIVFEYPIQKTKLEYMCISGNLNSFNIIKLFNLKDYNDVAN